MRRVSRQFLILQFETEIGLTLRKVVHGFVKKKKKIQKGKENISRIYRNAV